MWGLVRVRHFRYCSFLSTCLSVWTYQSALQVRVLYFVMSLEVTNCTVRSVKLKVAYLIK